MAKITRREKLNTIDQHIRKAKYLHDEIHQELRVLDDWKQAVLAEAESAVEAAADPATLDRIRVAAEASEVDPVMPPKFDMQDFAARVCGMQPGADPDPYRHRHAERWDGQS